MPKEVFQLINWHNIDRVHNAELRVWDIVHIFTDT